MKTRLLSVIVACMGLVALMICPAAIAANMDGGPKQQASVLAPAPAQNSAVGGLMSLGIGAGIIGAAAFLSMGLNKNFVPSPQDEGLRLEAAVTKAVNFDGTSFDQGLGFAPGGVGMPCAAVVNVTAADRTSSDETYTFVLEESADAITWTAAGPAVSVDVAAAVATLGAISVPGFVSKRYVRVKLTVAGTTPSITYEAWLNCNCC